MIVVILAGGRGTRISEFTKLIPKPMIPIKNIPIIIHIMKHYSKFGFNDFIIAVGYKGEIIKKYFTKNKSKKWNVKIINTGKFTKLQKKKAGFTVLNLLMIACEKIRTIYNS